MSGLAILWACQRGTLGARLTRLAVIPGVFLILIWSVLSLDRFAPGFSEKKFLEVLEAQQNGQVLTVADVEARLGRPLMTVSRADGRTNLVLFLYAQRRVWLAQAAFHLRLTRHSHICDAL